MRPVHLIAVLFAAGLSTSTIAQERRVPTQSELRLSYAPVVQHVAPAVVNVYAAKVVQNRNPLLDDPIFRRFFGVPGGPGGNQVQRSLGSGVIADAGGLIVTNNHVIEGADEVKVSLADKREFEAILVLKDPRTDLAILRVKDGHERFPVLDFADSDALQVGDLVLAIGNPFGVGQTVTSGIVSALAPTQVGLPDHQFFSQTDAAINPGNSGGALVDLKGNLIGINTAIFSRSGGSIGIGFAIPVNMVKTVVQSAETAGRIQRPWIGAETQDVTAEIADSLGFARPEGALIASLHPNSPLAVAGLKRGDLLLGIDGKPVENAKELSYRVATAQVGSSAIFEYQRGTQRRETRVELITAPETTARDETLMKGNTPFTGLIVANLSPAVADELGLPSGSTGVVASDVKGGPARRLFRKGDVILEVNGVVIDSVDTLNEAVNKSDSYSQFAINRSGRVIRLQLGG